MPLDQHPKQLTGLAGEVQKLQAELLSAMGTAGPQAVARLQQVNTILTQGINALMGAGVIMQAIINAVQAAQAGPNPPAGGGG